MNTNSYNATFTGKEGRITGPYASFHPNGKKKAQGNFVNGLRIGEWIVWDSLGKLIVKRLYKNGFEFEQLLPAIPKNGPIPLLSKPVYTLTRNADSTYHYQYLQERAVVTECRMWRFLPKERNLSLYNEDLLLNFILTAYKEKKIELFADDDFRKKFSTDSVAVLKPLPENVVGFTIKEDWFFDFDRMCSETRILGITLQIKDGNDTTELFTAYYPHCRKLMAKIAAQDKSNSMINNLDDVFFFRSFASVPYDIADVPDKKEKLLFESTGLSHTRETDLIEREHDLWLYYAGSSAYKPLPAWQE